MLAESLSPTVAPYDGGEEMEGEGERGLVLGRDLWSHLLMSALTPLSRQQ